ncbi:putative ring finger domain-containing protein [Rosellinia necatrix]|uniref:Putative ring finger domain-containing protein n=1 Tax=Rosellinia necatrix TaxID=77044 RepID=A0A1S7UL42_ROSNE|nr:putative ring finger domain-containing protein [Rosellinia necatrix]
MQAASSSWNWGGVPSLTSPANADKNPGAIPPSTPTHSNDHARRHTTPPETNEDGEPKHSRKCRICLEWVPPTYEDTGVLGGIRNRRPKRQYISEDGDRLISPCLCKGSIKYMHEGCLKLWMNENPSKGYKCDICKYQYRMKRLSWAQRLRSPFISLLMTLAILFVAIFMLGFVADPILGLWLDPVGTITDSVIPGSRFTDEDILDLGETDGWFEHLLKGVFSLGLLGFAKVFFAMSPWQWWNLRTSGIVSGGARRAGTGRQRMENINLTLVLIGVMTFLYTVWKATRKYTERTLDRASQKILNVRTDEDSDDEDDANGNN